MTEIYVFGEVNGTHRFHSTRDAACRQVRREPNWFLLGGHDDAPVMQGSARYVEGDSGVLPPMVLNRGGRS